MADHEIISAFIDNESFDPRALCDALSDPGGREFLIDMLTLRKLNQADDRRPQTAMPARSRRGVRFALAAAAITVSVLGGYAVGERAAIARTEPPAPTVLIKSTAPWQDVTLGGGR